MTLTIVVISRLHHPEIENNWRQRGFQLLWRVSDIVADPRNSLDRVKCIANERNKAMKTAIETFSSTTDIFMLDSYYADQYMSCHRLMSDYRMSKGNKILSGAIWGIWRTRISHLIKPHYKWFDTWAFPECRFIPYGWRPENENVVWGSGAIVPMSNFYRVETVGSAYIFPIEAFYKTSFMSCEDLSRTEHYYLCRNSGLPCYVDFNVDFYREAQTWPAIECIKHSIRDRL